MRKVVEGQLMIRILEDCLYTLRNNIINIVFPFGLCHTVILFMTFNKVKQQTERHQPHLALG